MELGIFIPIGNNGWIISTCHLPNDDIDMLAGHLLDLPVTMMLQEAIDYTSIVDAARS